ncbi:MAG: hypothetical protein IT423_14205 [Pirellulaceae bacterium]|nr:hypothetical protein [Pirellulaceae bacterium]
MCKRTGLWLLGVLILFGTGCGPSGPEKAPVSGVVTFQGQPVKHALVTFFPQGIDQAKLAFAQTDEQGRFNSLRSESPGDGAAVGKHMVTVTESWPLGADIPTTPDGMQKPPPRGPWADRYRDSSGSPLSVQVESKKQNNFEFELTK